MPALMNNYSAYAQSNSRNSALALQDLHMDERTSLSASIILVSFDEPNLNSRITNLIAEFSYLQDNWDEDGAKAPARETIEKAMALTILLSKHGQPIFHAAPGPNGEIMLDIRSKNKSKSMEIILYEEKSIAVMFPENDAPNQQNFNTEYLGEMLRWLNQK